MSSASISPGLPRTFFASHVPRPLPYQLNAASLVPGYSQLADADTYLFASQVLAASPLVTAPTAPVTYYLPTAEKLLAASNYPLVNSILMVPVLNIGTAVATFASTTGATGSAAVPAQTGGAGYTPVNVAIKVLNNVPGSASFQVL